MERRTEAGILELKCPVHTQPPGHSWLARREQLAHHRPIRFSLWEFCQWAISFPYNGHKRAHLSQSIWAEWPGRLDGIRGICGGKRHNMEFLARPRKRIFSIPMVLKPGLTSAGKTTHQLKSSSQMLQDPGTDEVSDQAIPSGQATRAAHDELVFARSPQSQGQAGPAEICHKMGVVHSRSAQVSCRNS